jgi:hypothetical protein
MENSHFKLEINSIEDFEKFIEILRNPKLNEETVKDLTNKLRAGKEELAHAVASQQA